MGVYKLSKKAETDLAKIYEFGIHKFELTQKQIIKVLPDISFDTT